MTNRARLSGEPSAGEPLDLDALMSRAVARDRRALGQLLSVAERGDEASDGLEALLHARLRLQQRERPHVIGVTGAPGTGKSTLTGCLLRTLTDAGRRPAVLAVDPSSPLSGGALLGDRIRMVQTSSYRTPSVEQSTRSAVGHEPFIRSMSTRGHGGGLALAVPAALRIFEACGYDPILIETAGVGQVEVAVTRTADTTVVVCAPQAGDAVQANKAGLLEMADVLVVNKADLPQAQDMRRNLEHMLDLGAGTATAAARGQRPEVVMTVATSCDGADDLAQAIARHREGLISTTDITVRRQNRIRQEIADRIARDLDGAAQTMLRSAPRPLLDALSERASVSEAAAQITALLLRDPQGRSQPGSR